MSRLLSRIMLAIFMLPLAAMVYLITVVGAAEWRYRWNYPYGYPRFYPFILAGLVTSAFILIYWILLWRGAVRWTPRRLLRTVMAGIAAIICGIGFGSF